jgi:quercetin dioxygenase-like cupin family protein
VVEAKVEEEFEAEMAASGRPVTTWSNAPGDVYRSHAHPYRKVLCCLSGSIVFHTPDGDVELAPGDRLVLEPGTPHAATVGPDGVRCAEAHG